MTSLTIMTIRATANAVKATELLIDKYKTQLSSDSIAQLQQQIQVLQTTKRRYDPQVVDLFKDLGIALRDAIPTSAQTAA